MVGWSEQLRSVTFAWLGAVRRSVRIRLCTTGCISEKMLGIIMILRRKKEGSENEFQRKIPGGQVYVPRLEPKAPIRLVDKNHAHYPSRHRTISKKKKMAQWRTSSTHDSIHTGVIGRCFHVHLTHQIHGVADVFPRSRRATSQTVEEPMAPNKRNY